MPTIAQAQAKALQGGFFDTFGQSRSGFSEATLSTVEAMMALYAEEFISKAVDKLNESNSVTTGKLADSIRFQPKLLRDGFKVEFLAADYYDYVNRGVQGLGPGNRNTTSPYKFRFLPPSKNHIQAIKGWLQKNNAVARAGDVSRYGPTRRERKAKTPDEALTSLAAAIAYNTKRKGMVGTGFWTSAFNEAFKDFAFQMSKALGRDIVVDLKEMEQNVKLKK
jgi:hypothetical protein